MNFDNVPLPWGTSVRNRTVANPTDVSAVKSRSRSVCPKFVCFTRSSNLARKNYPQRTPGYSRLVCCLLFIRGRMNHKTIKIPPAAIALDALDFQFLELGCIFLLRYLHHLPLQCDFDFTSPLEDDFSGEAHELLVAGNAFLVAGNAFHVEERFPCLQERIVRNT